MPLWLPPSRCTTIAAIEWPKRFTKNALNSSWNCAGLLSNPKPRSSAVHHCVILLIATHFLLRFRLGIQPGTV